jgi:predicted O-methyltransferase YrrM
MSKQDLGSTFSRAALAAETRGLAAPAGSLRDRDTRFYELLAGGARTRLLEGMLDLGLPELLGEAGALSARQIAERLALHPQRCWKFLHCLALGGLLVEEGAARGSDEARFRLSPEAIEYFGADGRGGFFFRDLVTYWRNVAVLPFADVLRGMPLPEAVRWPPPNLEAAEHLETWMRVTAAGAVRSLVESRTMEGARTLLDVGGGDGTIGCALAERYPELRVTVFNLPASAYIARRTIGERRKGDRVGVHEGDFLEDELPTGFDRVMFSRVLTDWAPDVCVQLLDKARRALGPDGRVVINEALLEGNIDYALAWEFRYIFYDTFGRAVYKSLDVYKTLLADAGLRIAKVTPMNDDAFYSVLEAVPV